MLGVWPQLGDSRAQPFSEPCDQSTRLGSHSCPIPVRIPAPAPPGRQSVTVALPREAGARAAPGTSSVLPSLVSPKMAFAATEHERFCPALLADLKLLLENLAELAF